MKVVPHQSRGVRRVTACADGERPPRADLGEALRAGSATGHHSPSTRCVATQTTYPGGDQRGGDDETVGDGRRGVTPGDLGLSVLSPSTSGSNFRSRTRPRRTHVGKTTSPGRGESGIRARSEETGHADDDRLSGRAPVPVHLCGHISLLDLLDRREVCGRDRLFLERRGGHDV